MSLAKQWSGLSRRERDWALGLLFITTVAVIWVLASFLVQDIEAEGLDPFLLTYIANSLFVVLLPIHFLSQRWKLKTSDAYAKSSATGEPDGAADGLVAEPTLDVDHSTFQTVDDASAALAQQGPPTMRHMLVAASNVAPLWFLAQWTFNLSLSRTSVTSNTILSSTSSLFTFGASCLVLRERFTAQKLAFILACIAGVGLITWSDSQDAKTPSGVAGDALVLLSAVCYAAYTTTIRWRLPNDEHVSMCLFFGLIGALNLACIAPVVVGLGIAKPALFAGLSTRVFSLTVLKGLADNVLSDYLWARAVLLIGPTVATAGMSIQVPFAALLDGVFKSPRWLHSIGAFSAVFFGAMAVLCGFFGIVFSSVHDPSVDSSSF